MGSKIVHRTANTRRAAVEDMRINHRRLDDAMAQEINGSWNLLLCAKLSITALPHIRFSVQVQNRQNSDVL